MAERRITASSTFIVSFALLLALSLPIVPSGAGGVWDDRFGVGTAAGFFPVAFSNGSGIDEGWAAFAGMEGDLFGTIADPFDGFGDFGIDIGIDPEIQPQGDLYLREDGSGSVRGSGGIKTILNGDEATASVELFAFDSGGITIDVRVRGVEVEEVEVEGATYQILTIQDRGYTEEVGRPQIPVVRETLAVPEGGTIRVTVLEANYSTYDGYRVYPVQPPEFDCDPEEMGGEKRDGVEAAVGSDGGGEGGDGAVEFLIDGEFYSIDAFYPGEMVVLGAPGFWRDLAVASIQINSVFTNPATGELLVYDHIRIRVEYGDDVAFTQRTIEPKFAEIYRRSILNFETLDVVVGTPKPGVTVEAVAPPGFNQVAETHTLDQTAKYLMIYHEDSSSYESLRPLVELHQKRGLSVEVWNVSTGVRPTPADIKALISGRYSAHPGMKYLLLVGDIDLLPWKPDWNGIPGDYWYGCVRGDDLWPELAVGRLAARSDAEVDQQVKKITAYASNPPGDWSKRVLLVAHKEDAPGKYQGCKESIRTRSYCEPLTFITAYGAAPAQGGDIATNADVKRAVDSGVGILNYRGHGSPTAWGSRWNLDNQDYTAADAHALANAGMTPVVFSIACYNAALDSTSQSLGEAFVKDDSSAVAFLGASRPSYTIPNHDFDRYLFDAVGSEEIYDIGWALNRANTRLITKYGDTSVYMDNVRMYLWLGDPALTIMFVPPNVPPDTPLKP
ncbi:C25 family cysteine peptidase [Candidatus Methanocrinis natronophilus]|uniref:C25 family cysteine peptidase n=1 Tax=Candidatus Methanocrinis natronophilus TaxID=3033396 RepID=A0ABT5XA35_9EURY|nr:C25 family cysteine peptidase [Candidatus Methanocrinis natronophilus]MDF0591533.1 C25 family cysteine peptidase [Candidatus Methanocrinis natronophilus]